MVDTVHSRDGVPVRLTDERWAHITEEHCEPTGLRFDVLETLAAPDRVLAGGAGELLGVKGIGLGKYLVVVYREVSSDGFVITAFMTRRIPELQRRRQLWP